MSIKKIIFIILGLIAVFSLIAVATYWYSINETGKIAKETTFTINKGETVKKISKSLYDQGLIKSKLFFELYVWLNDKQNKLQAGDYVLNSGQNIKQIVENLGNGRLNTVKLLIKEGEGEQEISQSLAKLGLFSENDFLTVTGLPTLDYRSVSNQPLPKDFSSDFTFLADKPKYFSLEGYLFPDTYEFSKNAQPEQVIKKILANFDRKLTPAMREEIARQEKSVYEIIIMASIIEKEVKSLEDMKIVSGIFWHRISIGQALQSDATLSYALNDKTAAHSLEELKTDSPYNSYKFKGLPPTPIGNPGLNAIIAAIYPTETEYNFFLNPPDSDQTIFSKSFEEHVRNKQKYLK